MPYLLGTKLFNFAAGMRFASTENLGLPVVHLTVAGNKRVICVKASLLWRLSRKKGDRCPADHRSDLRFLGEAVFARGHSCRACTSQMQVPVTSGATPTVCCAGVACAQPACHNKCSDPQQPGPMEFDTKFHTIAEHARVLFWTCATSDVAAQADMARRARGRNREACSMLPALQSCSTMVPWRNYRTEARRATRCWLTVAPCRTRPGLKSGVLWWPPLHLFGVAGHRAPLCMLRPQFGMWMWVGLRAKARRMCTGAWLVIPAPHCQANLVRTCCSARHVAPRYEPERLLLVGA